MIDRSIELPTRRSFLLSAAALPLVLTGRDTHAQQVFHPDEFWNRPREVWMKRPATGEEIRTVYWADGAIVRDEYLKLCWFMRDVRMERRIQAMRAKGLAVPKELYSTVAVSVVVLDIFYATNGWLDYHKIARPLLLTSGFRHRITNSETEGASENGRHIVGGAGDLVVPGVSPANVSTYGRWLRAGGVGWYPKKAFTHVDDGRLRTWRG